MPEVPNSGSNPRRPQKEGRTPNSGRDNANSDFSLDPSIIDEVLSAVGDDKAYPRAWPPEPSTILFDQSALDALLKEDDEKRAKEMAENPDEGALDQERIDELLVDGLPNEPPSELLELAQSQPPDGVQRNPIEEVGDVFDQSAIDALLGNASSPIATVISADESLDQDAINALLNEGQAAPAAPKAVEEELDQAAIDALMTGDTGSQEPPPIPPPSPVAKSGADQGPMDQSDIDALLRASHEEAAPTDDGVLDQTAIDALLKASPEPASSAEDTQLQGLDQSDIDVILAGDDLDKPLVKKDPEGLVVDKLPEDGPIDQSVIDSLIQDLASGNVVLSEPPSPENITPVTPPKQGVIHEEAPLSQEMIDALISAGGDEAKARQMAPTPPVAIPKQQPSADGLLSQGDLDAIIAQAKSRPKKKTVHEAPPQERIIEEVTAAPETPAAEKGLPLGKRLHLPRPRLRFSIPAGPAAEYLSKNLLKFTVSLAAAVVFSFATFTYLFTHQERMIDEATLLTLPPSDLIRAMNDARHLMDKGANAQAVEILDRAVEKSAPGPSTNEAEYLRAEASIQGLPESATHKECSVALDYINRAMESGPTSPRAPEALLWKSEVYEKSGNLLAALEQCERALERMNDLPHPEEVLSRTIELAMEAKQYEHVVNRTDQLLRDFPASAVAENALLMKADAYKALGRTEEAGDVCRKLVASSKDPRIQGQAQARLGRLALDMGNSNEAIALLEKHLADSPTIEGNDAVYLALARAYAATKRVDDVRRVLEDLVRLFPESETLQEAYVELGKALKAQGNAPEALRVMQQAAARYPKNAKILEEMGQLLSATGSTQNAAEVLVKAYEAGAKDPAVLLDSARLLRDSGRYKDAGKTYDQLIKQFPDSPQAFTAGIEKAESLFSRGSYDKAFQLLSDIAAATPAGPRHLPILKAEAQMYAELGLSKEAAERYRKVAALSSDPELLAQSAIALFDSGASDEALILTEKIDTSKLPPDVAHEILDKKGRTLMKADPKRAAEVLGKISTDFGDFRTERDEEAMMKAYVMADDVSGMQALLDDLEERVKKKPRDAPRLTAVAIEMADYLYDKSDWQTAADVYATAIASEGKENTPAADWARYQRANALLRMADFENSVILYDQIAASKSAWAQDAKLKADYVRLEQLLRELPVTPEPEKGTGTESATQPTPTPPPQIG